MPMLPGRTTLIVVALSTAAAVAAPASRPLGEFEAHGQIGGTPASSGNATYNAASQEYRITARSACKDNERDRAQFVWKRLTGDFILQARVELTGREADPDRAAGWLIRDSLDEGSPHLAVTLRGNGTTAFESSAGGDGARTPISATVSRGDVIQ